MNNDINIETMCIYLHTKFTSNQCNSQTYIIVIALISCVPIVFHTQRTLLANDDYEASEDAFKYSIFHVAMDSLCFVLPVRSRSRSNTILPQESEHMLQQNRLNISLPQYVKWVVNFYKFTFRSHPIVYSCCSEHLNWINSAQRIRNRILYGYLSSS